MRKINIYGCSWSHGIVENDFESWVVELGKLLPEYEITNYALQGSSIAFSCWMLEKTFDLNAINIFQCTMPGRFSYWKEFTFSDYQIQKKRNVKCFTNEVPVNRILAGTVDKKNKKFINEYYSKLTKPLELIEWKSYINYAMKQSSYIFTHRLHHINEHVDIDNIGNILGKNQYNKFIKENDNFHFGPSGNKWEAEFILDKLLTKGLL